MDNNLVLIQKNNFNLKITFPYSIEGKTIYFTAKKLTDKTNNNNNAIIDKSFGPLFGDDAIAGIYNFALSPVDTDNIPVGTYQFQVELFESSNRVAFKLKNLSVVENINKI